jgi:putative ubiquitin-RnfH superfamily antitoxin RatB of RatAB toxin-antitoxin module
MNIPRRFTIPVLALSDGRLWQRTVQVPQGQTLGWAVQASGVLGQFPALVQAKIGVHGKVLPPTTLLQAGDRVEIYTPCDPAAMLAARNRRKTTSTAGQAPKPLATSTIS